MRKVRLFLYVVVAITALAVVTALINSLLGVEIVAPSQMAKIAFIMVEKVSGGILLLITIWFYREMK